MFGGRQKGSRSKTMPKPEIVSFDSSEGTVPETRIIGLDIRARSFGFIVLEGATVLDCGTRACERSRSSECLGERFRYVLSIYKPSVVIVRSHSQRTPNVQYSDKATAAVLRTAAKEAG